MNRRELAIALLLMFLASITEHHYDVTVFYYSTLLLLHGFNPYNVPKDAPWIYSNPLAYPQWYAYPPFALILMALASLPFYLIGAFNIFTFRIALKLVLLSSLYLLARYLRDKKYALIFNPLIFFVTIIHGMIDIIAVVLFVDSLIRLKRGDKLWPITYGLALATKQTIWITVPAYMGYAISKKMIKEIIFSIIIFLVIIMPFFGKGFINNVLTIHEDRPPASLGYTGVPLILMAGDMVSLHMASIIAPCYSKPIPKPGWGEIVLTAVMVALLLYSFVMAYKNKLMKALILSSLAFVLFSKVVSPQNLLLPLVILIMIDVPTRILNILSLLAALVDLTTGTVFNIYGYLAEDVLNAFGTSIVYLYRQALWSTKVFGLLGLVSLVLYHLSVIILVYSILKKRIGIKKFMILYLIYLVLVINSVSYGNVSEAKVTNGFSFSRGAMIWIWVNPTSGFKSGDYLHFNFKTAYWDYTYPLALKTVRWLKKNHYDYLALVYNVDRDNLYYYVPWLFALAKYNMPFVWVIVPPKDYKDYVYGFASYPTGYDIRDVLSRVYMRTPVYINKKIEMIRNIITKKIKMSSLSNMIKRYICPLKYLTSRGRAIIFVYGANVTLKTQKYLVEPIPSNVTIINDFYEGRVLWGTPITPKGPQTVLQWLHRSK